MHKIDRETIKNSLPFLVESIRWLKRRKNELSSLQRHISRRIVQKENEKINQGIIKVVFICQYIPAWSKNKQIYEALKCDDRFQPSLLCVPNRISANQLRDPDDLSNDTYEYFRAHGYEDAVNALIGKNEWLDLRAYHPDYVICNRYDRPMPKAYTSSELSKYTKICFITYSGVALRKADESMFDKPFVANTFCFFAESEGKKREVIRWNSFLCKLKLSNAVNCGIPAIENVFKAKHDVCDTWDFTKNTLNIFRVIYAPRWTIDPAWGGSSFLKYKSIFFSIADEHPEISILVRPHPLMFNNFIHTGLMTEEEVKEYKERCDARQNIRIDESKEYRATFWNSSVLICDFSSIIIEYFVTGKPIVYLAFDEKIEYTELMLAILSGCYIVRNEKELKNVMNDLLSGYDPLEARRKEVCEEYLVGTSNTMASENMKQFLIERYKE